MNKIIACIVLYNKAIVDSNAINSLRQLKNVDLIIVDNSDQAIDNEAYAKVHKLNYIANHENIGLSKAYNKIIKLLLPSNYQYLLLLDDDTTITQEYIDELNQLVNNNYDVIIPRIIDKASKKLYSPKVYNHTSLLTHLYNDKPYKHIKAINSGLCIKIEVFNHFQYDENNFLYFVDVDFFENCVNRQNLSTTITKTSLVQELSHLTQSLTDGQLKQMTLRLTDSRNFNPPLIHNLYKLAFVTQMYLRYHDKRLLKLLKV